MKRLLLLAAVAAAGIGGATALAQSGNDDPYLQAEPDVTSGQMFRLPASARCDAARTATVRITPPLGAVLGSVRVLVDGRQAARLTGVPRAASATVRVPREGARVTVTGETLGGQRLHASRVYSDCTRPPEPTPPGVGVGEG